MTNLAELLEIKSTIGVRLREAYKKSDRAKLKSLAEEDMPRIASKLDVLRKSHREEWLSTCKPFGWEVVDIRYGGVAARIDSAASRVRDYLDGRTESLEELEAERLYFDGSDHEEAGPIGRCNRYRRIVTAGYF